MDCVLGQVRHLRRRQLGQALQQVLDRRRQPDLRLGDVALAGHGAGVGLARPAPLAAALRRLLGLRATLVAAGEGCPGSGALMPGCRGPSHELQSSSSCLSLTSLVNGLHLFVVAPTRSRCPMSSNTLVLITCQKK